MASYTTCPACTPLKESTSIRPLPDQDSVLIGTDAIDWNVYYWGYHDQPASGRRARPMLLPLPRNITERIPQELMEHIIDFLALDFASLRRCALVCRAWYHHSQTLLYCRVQIVGRSGYDAVARFALQSPRTKRYLAFTRILCLATAHKDQALPRAQRNCFQVVPLTLGGSLPNLQCIGFFNCLFPPYNASFVSLMSRFTEVVHLVLHRFEVCSFVDLRRIICSFPKLRELHLGHGSLTCAGSPFSVTNLFSRPVDPRIVKLTLTFLDLNLLPPLASWISWTDVCKEVTNLAFTVNNIDSDGIYFERIMRTLGPSLTSVSFNASSFRQGNLLDPLAYCTSLVDVDLTLHPTTVSWSAVVSALRETLAHLSATIRTISLQLILLEAGYSILDAPPRPDSDFGSIDLQPLHDIITSSRFDSLSSVKFELARNHGAYPLVTDVDLPEEEVEHRVRFHLLHPWEQRGILSVRCKDWNLHQGKLVKESINSSCHSNDNSQNNSRLSGEGYS